MQNKSKKSLGLSEDPEIIRDKASCSKMKKSSKIKLSEKRERTPESSDNQEKSYKKKKISESQKEFMEVNEMSTTQIGREKEKLKKEIEEKQKKLNYLEIYEKLKIEQERQRRISIYSPLSFNQKSDLKNDNNYITNFNNEAYADIDKDDVFPNFDFFPLKKVKKTLESNKINKKTYKEIEFYDERNKKYKYGLFKDNNIFDKDFTDDKEGLYFNNRINCGESTDDDKKENDCKRCINILKEGIEFFSNNPGYISRNINNNK